MANNKTALDFFRSDTNKHQDRALKRLKKAYRCDGFAVYDYILSMIYGDKGCYLVWDIDTAFDIAEYWGHEEGYIEEIVGHCLTIGLFNKKVFEKTGKLTSQSIQDRYTEMCMAAKRKGVIIPEEIRIIPEQSHIIQEESPEIPEESQQSKVKESKVNTVTSNEVTLSGNHTDFTQPESGESSAEDPLLFEEENLPPIPGTPPPAERVNYHEIVDYFNSKTKGVFGMIRYPLSDKRRDTIRARIREHGKDTFFEMIDKAADSTFLKGGSKRGFKASFDWLINPTNFAKVLEGNYEDRTETEYGTDSESNFSFMQNIAAGAERGREERKRASGG